MRTILRPRKPRVMETAEVERLLRDASSAERTEPSPDLVTRAVERALALPERGHSSWSPRAAGGSRGVAFGAVALAGAAAVAVAVNIGVPSSPRLPRTAMVNAAPPAIARIVIAPAAATTVSPRPLFVSPTVAPTVHHANSHRLAARHRRARWRNALPVRLVALPLPAPKGAVASPTTASPKSALHLSARTLAVAAPAPRPFWHDEQVERDDYTVSAPALIAQGTGQEVTSLTPAVVQIAFSTTRPAPQGPQAAYESEGSNP